MLSAEMIDGRKVFIERILLLRMIRTKSVFSSIQKSDGLRILATRYRGRGLKKSRYDVWMANLGPSEELLRAFQGGRINWKEFVRRYKEEMASSKEVDSRNATIRNHGQKFTLRLLQKLSRTGSITILCHCAENEQHCHRHILKQLIENV